MNFFGGGFYLVVYWKSFGFRSSCVRKGWVKFVDQVRVYFNFHF